MKTAIAGEQRREQGQHQAGDRDVQPPLQRQGRARRVGEAEVEHRQLGEAVELDARSQQPVVLGQEGEAEAGGLALLDQVLGVALAHLLLGDDDALDVVFARHPRDLLDRAQPRQRGAPVLVARLGEVAGQPQARLRVGRDPPRDRVCQGRRADHDADRDPGEALPDEAQHGAGDEAGEHRADPDDDRALGRERPGRAEPEQAVEHDRAEGAGGDQRGQLVERAVADAAMVVVVEPMQLQHQEPGRREEGRPEELGDVRGRGDRGGDAECGEDRHPVPDGEQAPQHRPAPP